MWRQEGVAGTGGVAADQDVVAVAVGVGDLRQRLVEHGDVVGGGVRPGVARAQQPGQRFAGGVEEAQQRVVAERLLPGLGRRLLLGVAEHDRGVQVQDQTRGSVNPATVEDGSRPVSAACAHATSRACARAAADPGQGRIVDAVQHPPRGRRPRPPARTARAGCAAPPGRRSPRRRRRASPPDPPRPGPGHVPMPAAATAPARPTSPPTDRSRRPDRPAAERRRGRPRHARRQ